MEFLSGLDSFRRVWGFGVLCVQAVRLRGLGSRVSGLGFLKCFDPGLGKQGVKGPLWCDFGVVLAGADDPG